MGTNRVTIIYDNRVARDGIYPGWGFSALVEKDGKRLLVDTGGDKIILEHNAAFLGIDLKKTDYLFLSHEHCDHVGALSSALHEGLIVVYPDSFSSGFKDRIADAKLDAVVVTDPVEFAPGFRSTGELGTEIKEQSLIIDGTNGPVLITGCAHPGIVNIARRATDIVGRPLALVIGGFHLLTKSDAQVHEIAAALKKIQIGRIGPCHCTGDRAIALLADDFGPAAISVKAGVTIDI